jgi:ribonuclease HI
MALKEVTIFADGACLGNPGPGGYGVVLIYGRHRRELAGGVRRTTNNRMELMAAISGLAALREPCSVTLFSDSEYVVNGMTAGWAKRWRARGWRREKNKPALNWDLWAQLLHLAEKHRVTFQGVRGHAGDPENERCDQLAVEAAQGQDLAIDCGFESPQLPTANEAIDTDAEEQRD